MEKIAKPFEFKLYTGLLRFTGRKAKNLRELRKGGSKTRNKGLSFPPIRFWIFLLTLIGSLAYIPATEAQEWSRGQLVYVPIYSHIYYGDRGQAFLLTGTLSVRNTDPDRPITIVQADYHDSEGKLIRKYLLQPLVLGPLASTRFIVKASDKSGGSGAHFLVRWKSEGEVNPPILEGVMIGASGQQGISFTSRGQVIRER